MIATLFIFDCDHTEFHKQVYTSYEALWTVMDDLNADGIDFDVCYADESVTMFEPEYDIKNYYY
jgi:hypothetical protein